MNHAVTVSSKVKCHAISVQLLDPCSYYTTEKLCQNGGYCQVDANNKPVCMFVKKLIKLKLNLEMKLKHHLRVSLGVL